ncbi:hypothetical protein V1282_002159 [Nitrobacteraceae bacterium AZCC 2146]
MVHPAAKFQFERALHEYARWLAVAEDDRSPAPAWWWSPALAVRSVDGPMPHDWSQMMRLPGGASYADAAQTFLHALADQTVLPWPEEFPRRYRAPAAMEADSA